MARKSKIRTPITQWWRRMRYQYVPFLTFLGCVALVLYLWQRQVGGPNAVGEVFALRMDATSAADGTLLPLPGEQLRLHDFVEKGQVLARIDESPLLMELAALQVELKQMEAEIPATIESERMAQIDREQQLDGQRMEIETEQRRIAERIEQLRLEEVQQKADALAYRVTFAVQGAKAAHLEELSRTKLLDLRGSIEVFDAQTARDEAKQALDGAELVIREIELQRKELTSKLASMRSIDKAPEIDLEKVLEPQRAAIEARRKQIELLDAQVSTLSVVAPISGTVTFIYAQPGQSIPLGAPIATIASHTSDYIVTYIRQEQLLQPELGMAVEVRPRRRQRENLAARVERIGPQIELIPEKQRILHDTNIFEFGLPVWISMPDGGNLRPGEVVDLHFRPRPR
jgi:multidrug resistance efflux pump